MLDSTRLQQAQLVDDNVFVCAEAVADHTQHLTIAEQSVIASSVSIRQHTYATGRLCAKKALRHLGVEPADYPAGLLRQADGSVAWPAGIIGSLSHTNDWAIAAVAKADGPLRSLGIDVEQIDRVDKDVLRLIATDAERDALEADVQLLWGRVALFSIKESVYKCLRPIFGEFIRFKDVQIADLTRSTGAGLCNDDICNDDICSDDTGNGLTLYCPRVQLLLPALATCCDESRLKARLAILPSHVVSYVSYEAEK